MRQILLAIVLIAVPVALFSGYEIYAASGVQAPAGLGDLSAFETIIADVQALVDKGDMPGAARRIGDFESAWDQAETALRPMNPTEWGNIDQASDAALGAVRKSKPDATAAKTALTDLMATLNDPSKAS